MRVYIVSVKDDFSIRKQYKCIRITRKHILIGAFPRQSDSEGIVGEPRNRYAPRSTP